MFRRRSQKGFGNEGRKGGRLSVDPLRADRLTKKFGEREALKGVSLNLRRGEIYGLIGSDGAGKTTLLRTLMGALKPEEGEVLVEGIRVEEHPDAARELLGYMPQLYGLYDDLTVEENLRFFGELQGLPGSLLRDRMGELLDFVRLSPFRRRRTGALSGGMYKKLAIACSIIHSPRLLILDEPTNGVDPVSRRELWALLFRLAEEGVTVLVSTPYMDEAERCHRVGLIFEGEIRREGSPASLMEGLKGRVFLVDGAREDVARTLCDEMDGGAVLSLYRAGGNLRLVVRKGEEERIAKLFESAFRPGSRSLRRGGGEAKGARLEATIPAVEDIFMELQEPAKEEGAKG